jgi:hypothetical protein
MQRKIYLPGNINTNQRTTSFDDVIGIPPNGNIDLDQWIQFQLDNGYITTSGGGGGVGTTGTVLTNASITIEGATYPAGTSTQTILNALNVDLSTSANVLTTAPIVVAGVTYATGTSIQTILLNLGLNQTAKFYSTQGYSLPLQLTIAEGYYTPATATLGIVPSGGRYYAVFDGN